ncbi:MAG: hypothetical protein OXC26_10920 [Albidovulum sp.]|nr:hypothetical protein [Albidovulum sp.]
MRARRSRWKIENETFNTLKSFDNLEHSYRHGKTWLGSLIPAIMLLEYLVENVLNLFCPVHRAVRVTFHARTEMWKIMCAFILTGHPRRLGGPLAQSGPEAVLAAGCARPRSVGAIRIHLAASWLEAACGSAARARRRKAAPRRCGR